LLNTGIESKAATKSRALAAHSLAETSLYREQSIMREVITEAAICVFLGIICLAVAAWIVVSGRIVDLDGIALAIIVLTIGGFFLFDVFWSYRTGELGQTLDGWRKSKAEKNVTNPAAQS
jgi:hypothetical protein